MKELFIMYDDQCPFCIQAKNKIKSADKDNRFQWIPISGQQASDLASLHEQCIDPKNPESFILCDAEGKLWLEKSRAILYITQRIGGPYHLLSYMLTITPILIADWVYGIISRNRNCLGGVCKNKQL